MASPKIKKTLFTIFTCQSRCINRPAVSVSIATQLLEVAQTEINVRFKLYLLSSDRRQPCSLCHLTILLLLHSQKSTEQNKEMQTLAKSVTQNKATSCNSLPSLTTETFPYLSHVCTPSPPPTWSNPKLSECNKNQWVQNDRRSYSNHFHPIGIYVTLEHCINQPIVHKLST